MVLGSGRHHPQRDHLGRNRVGQQERRRQFQQDFHDSWNIHLPMHYTTEYDWIGSRNSVRRGLICVVIAAMTPAMAPALAMAQRGGGFGGGRAPGLRREPGIEIPKPVNVLNLLIEHRQEVALSDS